MGYSSLHPPKADSVERFVSSLHLVQIVEPFLVQIPSHKWKVTHTPFGGIRYFSPGGEDGIRTHGTIACTYAFQAHPFDHSGTSPCSTECNSKKILVKISNTRPFPPLDPKRGLSILPLKVKRETGGCFNLKSLFFSLSLCKDINPYYNPYMTR